MNKDGTRYAVNKLIIYSKTNNILVLSWNVSFDPKKLLAKLTIKKTQWQIIGEVANIPGRLKWLQITRTNVSQKISEMLIPLELFFPANQNTFWSISVRHLESLQLPFSRMHFFRVKNRSQKNEKWHIISEQNLSSGVLKLTKQKFTKPQEWCLQQFCRVV